MPRLRLLASVCCRAMERLLRLARGGAIVGLFFATACGGDDAGGGRSTPDGSRGDEAVRELCNASGRRVEATDVNNDTRPDIRHVYEGSTERCTEYDMNFDGHMDVTRFF